MTVATWPFGIGPVGANLDFSWISGLYMATDEGRDFGTEIVYTFGPLGFLSWPSPWIGSLAMLAFGYWVMTYGGLIAVMTWSLSRTVGLAVAAFIVLAVSLSFGFLGQLPIVLTVGLCFLALREDRPRRRWPPIFGGGLLCAFEPLVKLSVGPPVVLIILLAMFGARADRRRWAGFLATSIVGFFALWFVTGQGLGNLWDYADNGFQIIKGYCEAMGYDSAEPGNPSSSSSPRSASSRAPPGPFSRHPRQVVRHPDHRRRRLHGLQVRHHPVRQGAARRGGDVLAARHLPDGSLAAPDGEGIHRRDGDLLRAHLARGGLAGVDVIGRAETFKESLHSRSGPVSAIK